MAEPPAEQSGSPELGESPESTESRLRRLREGAVRADSNPKTVSWIRRLRQRLPGDDRFGDALSTAGDEPAQVLARRASALHPEERESAAHELGLTALQLWQSLSEKQGRGRGESEVALLFTDLVGF